MIYIIMGSQSDWPIMQEAANILKEFDCHFQAKIISAHRTPDRLVDFAKNVEANNAQIIIAGAGGAAHLPGMVASMTHIPVLGVPIQSKALSGIDSLLSIVQMPAGVPVGTLAIGVAGAKNAALMALSILSLTDAKIKHSLKAYRDKQTASISEEVLDEQ